MTADERRHSVLRAAAASFAESGFQGTSTEDVARRAGISQPYIFRLFESKKGLFLAVVEECFQRTCAIFEQAARNAPPEMALKAMGSAYMGLITDAVTLQVQMHAFAASVNDPDVRRVSQAGMRRIWQMAATASGANAFELRQWLATGMLCNMIAALGLEELDEPWAKDVQPEDKKAALSGRGSLPISGSLADAPSA